MKNINSFLKIFSILMLFVFMFSVAVFAEPDSTQANTEPSTDQVITHTEPETETKTKAPAKVETSTERTTKKAKKTTTTKAPVSAKKTTTAPTKKTTDNKSSDASLKKLEIKGVSKYSEEIVLNLVPVFKSDVKSYQIEAPDGVVSVTVNAQTADSKAKLEAPKSVVLNDGENIVKIVVTAEDGNKQTYEIIIKCNIEETTTSELTFKTPTTAVASASQVDDNSLNTYTKLGIVFALGGASLLGISIYLFFKGKK